ncbi:class II lanthipeptide, LchA2/BrtA2 family [Streptomyces yerevanensis]|uniref:class II lanthipeptide, LchA2/BrtA2 family n=1 Tax=Streptomyces yerevanensis TaxID=66378 RepID=UPI000527986D|nr:class II lanthipeptide, LchA2/BrtA2 family [Streptomyces yerevanensis]
MKGKNEDMLDRYDEIELMELSEEDVYGGTAWACATVSVASAVLTAASAAVCPTTKCTSKC